MADPLTDPQFQVCLDGTTNCKTVGDKECASFDNLVPGEHAISEKDPGKAWAVTYPDGTKATVKAGDVCTDKQYDVKNTYQNPCFRIEKYVSVDGGTTWLEADTAPGPEAEPGDSVQFKLEISNCGNVDVLITGINDDFGLGPAHTWDFGTFPLVLGNTPIALYSESITITAPEACNEDGWLDTITVNGAFSTSWTDQQSDPAWYHVICGTEWCGLTQGFWKNNIDKYVGGWTKGRQVCDQFFVNENPGAVCDAITTNDALCGCEGASDCTSWTCLLTKFNDKSPQGKAHLQMIAMDLTMQYHEAPQGSDFYIDCSQAPCAAGLGDLCSGGGTVSIQDVWARIVDYNTPGGLYDVSKAATLADCMNNYNDGKCSPDVTFAHCDPGSFNGLSGCLGGTKK
jgi:hypothetical protein